METGSLAQDDIKLANSTIESLSKQARAELAIVMHPQEKVLWSDRPVARHAWTLLSHSYVKSRIGRAIGIVVMEILAMYLLAIGLVFLAACVDIVWTFSSWGSVILTLVLFLPISLGICYAGAWCVDAPMRMIRLAKLSVYIVTDRNAFILTDHGKEVVVQQFVLERLGHPPEAFRLLQSGVGDVVLDHKSHMLVGGDSDTSEVIYDRGFPAVPNAVSVVKLIDDARLARAPVAEAEERAEMQADYQGHLRRAGRL